MLGSKFLAKTSIQAQIILIVVSILLTASGLVTFFALRSTNATLRREAIDAVGTAASTRRELLFNLLKNYRERVHSRLALAKQLCRRHENLQVCEQEIFANFQETTHASALQFYPKAGRPLSLGLPAANFRDLPLPNDHELARFGRGRDGRVYFMVRIFDHGDEIRVEFPSDNVDPIFGNYEDLGESGESFLSDKDGYFLTPGRFTTPEILKMPIGSKIMGHCLQGHNGEAAALDYRNVRVIHGFRSLPEIGGGCIMTHINEDVAFARSAKLERNIIEVTLITVALACFLAIWLSRFITRPIERLALAAHALQMGNFKREFVSEGPSEVRTLARAFAEMAASLISEIEIRERFQLQSEQQKAQFEAIFNSISDGAVFSDMERKIQLVNPAFLSMFGYAREDLIGLSSTILYPTDTDFKARDEALGDMPAGQGKLLTIHFRRKSGERFASESMVARVLDSQGHPVGYIAIIRDISVVKSSQAALQESEERFRRAVVEAPYPVMIRDETGAILQVNKMWSQLTGYAQSEIPDVQSWVRMATRQNESRDELLKLIRENSSMRTRQDLGEFTVRAKNGQELLWNISVTPLGETREGRKLLMSMATDVTELKLSERELSKAVNSRDEFLATLSHELRTPMNIILGWIEILRSGRYDEALFKQALETLSRNAKVQKDLIDDLLDVSRIISGKFSLNFEPTDLGDILREATNSLIPRAAEKEIALTVEIAERKFMTNADSTKIIQVAVNLLQNALKFTPRGGHIRARLDGDESGRAALTVADSGVGIEASFLPHVFDRLRQEDMGTTRAHSGLGLGLAISRHIIESHGGTIKADSEGRGKGATFTVTLPLLEAHALAPKPAEEIARHTTMKGLRVLIVDDSPDILFLLRTWLEQEGAVVDEGESAREGLNLLQTKKFDVLLSDIGMPTEDGYFFIREVRALDGPMARIPAIALTAYAREEERTRVVEAGFQMHIAKPTAKPTVIATIQRLLDEESERRARPHDGEIHA